MLSTSDENVRQKEVFVASRLLRKKRIYLILDFKGNKKDVFSILSLMSFLNDIKTVNKLICCNARQTVIY